MISHPLISISNMKYEYETQGKLASNKHALTESVGDKNLDIVSIFLTDGVNGKWLLSLLSASKI